MKIIALSVFLVLFVSACSSGTSVSDLPPQVTSSTFSGDFITSNNLGAGSIQLDLTDDGSGSISGNLIISNESEPACICTSEVTGTQTGFDLILQTGDCTVTQRPEICDSPTETLDTLGEVIDSFCPAEDFTGSAQIALTGTLNSFSGTYVVNGDVCLAPVFDSTDNVRSGSISVSR